MKTQPGIWLVREGSSVERALGRPRASSPSAVRRPELGPVCDPVSTLRIQALT
jgi:hypothetical protein